MPTCVPLKHVAHDLHCLELQHSLRQHEHSVPWWRCHGPASMGCHPPPSPACADAVRRNPHLLIQCSLHRRVTYLTSPSCVAYLTSRLQVLAPRAAVKTTGRRTSWTQQTCRAATVQHMPSSPTPACRSGRCLRRLRTPSSLPRAGWPASSAGWGPAERGVHVVCFGWF